MKKAVKSKSVKAKNTNLSTKRKLDEKEYLKSYWKFKKAFDEFVIKYNKQIGGFLIRKENKWCWVIEPVTVRK